VTWRRAERGARPELLRAATGASSRRRSHGGEAGCVAAAVSRQQSDDRCAAFASALARRADALSTELENHLGIGDKTLAEFIISLAEGQSTTAAFHTALVANGAELPLDFCGTLLGIIQRLRPGRPGGAASAAAPAAAARSDAKYPALAVPDSRQRAAELNKELLGGRNPLLNVACVPATMRLLGTGCSALPVLRCGGCPPALHTTHGFINALTRRLCRCSDDPRFLEERQPEARREERCVGGSKP
jgi:hypothetical protein